MLEVIDATNNEELNAIEPLAAEFTPTATDPQNEIGEAITGLWSAHLHAKHAVRATNDELRTIRAKLGEQLSEMKKLLARPGCDGQWSGFLRERQIPRATADRLVARHQRSLNPEANCVSEEISEPTDEDVRRLFTSVWPRLKPTLRSQQNLDLFVHLLKSECEYSEATAHDLPAGMPATATFDPVFSDGDFVGAPESCLTGQQV